MRLSSISHKRLIALRAQTIARLDRRQEVSVTRDGRLFHAGAARPSRAGSHCLCRQLGTEAQAVPDRLRADQWRVIFTTQPMRR